MEIPVAAGIEHFLFEPEDTSLPDFVVLEFTGREGISQLTHFTIKLLSTDPEIDFSKILSKRASLKIWCWQDDDYSRVYHGIICSFQQIGQQHIGEEDYAVFQAEMVPILWRTTLNYSCRIFQEMSVPDIIEYILADVGLQGDDYRLSLQGTYDALTQPPREFCIQYRETNFNFISRLMEEEGIFYFFEYGDTKETLVIADSNSAFEDTSPLSEVRYEIPTGLQPLEEEYIHPLTYKETMLSSVFALTDYNYDTPGTDLHSSSSINQTDSYETYDYPGHFGFLDRGSDVARIRNEESETGRKIVSGGSNCRSFCAGYLYTLTDPPRSDLEGQFLLTRVNHHGVQGGPMATDVKMSYENKFECIPADVPYRPPRVTPKARVQGTQTATVVGSSGTDLYMDEKGRAKIQFHWDMEGQDDENSSCWVRVSHGYAGGDHGIQFHPLVGDEVIVDFLEGDPDRPIIVGRVYNAEKMPPLNPDDSIQNIILTPYQHRLIFDDKAATITLNTGGNEKILMADAGEDSDYGNSVRISTADDHNLGIAKGTKLDGIALVTANENMALLQDDKKQVGLQTTDKHHIILSDENKQISIKSADTQIIKLDDPSTTITISNDGTVAISTGTLTIDATTIEAKAQGNITLDAKGNIDIKAGGNLSMEATANATLVGMQTTVEGTAKVTTTAPMNNVDGLGMVIIQGGLVKIN